MYITQITLIGLYVSSWILLNLPFFYSQTGALDRSKDIMMQIDNKTHRECESLYTPEKVVRNCHAVSLTS